MLDINIVKLIGEGKLTYEQVKDYSLPKHITNLLKLLNNYITEAKITPPVNWDSFLSWLQVKYPGMSSEIKDIYEQYIQNAIDTKSTLTGGEEETLKAVLRRHYAAMITELAMEIAANPDEDLQLSSISELVDAYIDRLTALDILYSEEPEEADLLESISEEASTVTSGFKWRLDPLNRTLGPINPGDFILFGGRPDSGKTTLLASELTNFAEQSEGNFLWITNEERADKVKLRLVQAALGISRTDFYSDVPRHKKDYNSVIRGTIVVLDGHTFSVEEVENHVKRLNPKVIVFDQLCKIQVGGHRAKDNDVAKIAYLAYKAREWAQRCPVLSTVWADASSGGAHYIEMEQLYGSKTALQGEADAIVTIGRGYSDPNPNTRYLYAPKNKLAFCDDVHRNARWIVRIQPNIGRYTDV